MLTRIIIILVSLFFSLGLSFATDSSDLNVREVTIGDTGNYNTNLNEFMKGNNGSLYQFFFGLDSTSYWSDGILGAFTAIAFNIKNFFIAIAAIFLIIAVVKLLFSSNDEESVKKWRSSIIWTSVGIFFMQIAFSIWSTLILRNASDRVGSSLGWEFWVNVLAPVVNVLQMLASFAFIIMAIWAFYVLATSGGDEEQAKKAKNTILYAVLGYVLIKIPYEIVKAFYGKPWCEWTSGWFASMGTCDIKSVDLEKWIGIIGKLFTFFNTFLSVICVILIVYAAWLVLISGGDEEKLKKAKSTILYIALGFILLVASHAIFRFFILKG